MPAAQPIVIAYALAGVGHRRAAEALASALRAQAAADVHVVDILDYCPRWFRWLYPRAYNLCVQRLPALWALSFLVTNWRWVERLAGSARRAANRRLAGRFLRWLGALQPSVVVSTHFFPAEVVAGWKGRVTVAPGAWVVVTDYWPHRWWVNAGTEHYFVGLPETHDELTRHGVDAAQVTVSGIPVDPQFYGAGDARALRAQLGVPPERFVLLVASGGVGMGPMVPLCQSLNHVPSHLAERLAVVAVAGASRTVEARLRAWASLAPFPVKVFGFTTQMHELMAACDVVVTKPGGLTVTEALVMGRPLLLFAPIWGQETGNARLLTHHGSAMLLPRPHEAAQVIARWLEHPEELERLRARASLGLRQPATELIWSHRR